MADETKKNWMEELEQFEPDLFWQKHSRRIIWGTVAVLAVFAIAFYWQNQKAEEQDRAALRLAQANTVPALQQLIAAYQGQPIAAPALMRLGDQLYRSQQYGEAAAAYEKMLGAYPTHVLADGARLGLAAVKEAEGKLADARNLYQQLAMKPNSYTGLSARLGLARTTELLGEKREARQRYEEVLMMTQGSPRQQEALVRWTVLGRDLPATPATNAAPAALPLPGMPQ
jgi:tetratricopeptide (TPR) repeat protein